MIFKWVLKVVRRVQMRATNDPAHSHGMSAQFERCGACLEERVITPDMARIMQSGFALRIPYSLAHVFPLQFGAQICWAFFMIFMFGACVLSSPVTMVSAFRCGAWEALWVVTMFALARVWAVLPSVMNGIFRPEIDAVGFSPVGLVLT